MMTGQVPSAQGQSLKLRVTPAIESAAPITRDSLEALEIMSCSCGPQYQRTYKTEITLVGDASGNAGGSGIPLKPLREKSGFTI